MAKTPAEKLGVKPGSTLVLINAPGAPETILGSLPDGVRVETAGGGGGADVALMFAGDSAELREYAPVVLAAADDDGKVWIAYRKGGVSDLSRDTLMPALTGLGWHGVSLVSLDATWAAARFRRLEQIGR
ncbi:hypothetical protein HC031_20625 [Planosporangium thailandense]|uniref:DUF3052 domain-containing protein n=1 Tax=Planosporangium thailandense TaxID=765197 RepID=A0ABX0Y191_9ACTN|nr:hypothetical protein [Planosporangium thailandense]NJC72103.1 hypothetical protein [Planosporangium thailandense]